MFARFLLASVLGVFLSCRVLAPSFVSAQPDIYASNFSLEDVDPKSSDFWAIIYHAYHDDDYYCRLMELGNVRCICGQYEIGDMSDTHKNCMSEFKSWADKNKRNVGPNYLYDERLQEEWRALQHEHRMRRTSNHECLAVSEKSGIIPDKVSKCCCNCFKVCNSCKDHVSTMYRPATTSYAEVGNASLNTYTVSGASDKSSILCYLGCARCITDDSETEGVYKRQESPSPSGEESSCKVCARCSLDRRPLRSQVILECPEGSTSVLHTCGAAESDESMDIYRSLVDCRCGSAIFEDHVSTELSELFSAPDPPCVTSVDKKSLKSRPPLSSFSSFASAQGSGKAGVARIPEDSTLLNRGSARKASSSEGDHSDVATDMSTTTTGINVDGSSLYSVESSMDEMVLRAQVDDMFASLEAELKDAIDDAFADKVASLREDFPSDSDAGDAGGMCSSGWSLGIDAGSAEVLNEISATSESNASLGSLNSSEYAKAARIPLASWDSATSLLRGAHNRARSPESSDEADGEADCRPPLPPKPSRGYMASNPRKGPLMTAV